MRTTINLPDDLLASVKKAAAESGETMTRIIEDALRQALARRRATGTGRAPRVSLPTYGRGGPLPGVDLDDTAALLDLTDPVRVPGRR